MMARKININDYIAILEYCTAERSTPEISAQFGFVKSTSFTHLNKLVEHKLMITELIPSRKRGGDERLYKSVLGWTIEQVNEAFKSLSAKSIAHQEKVKEQNIGHTFVKERHTPKLERYRPKYGCGMSKMAYC